MRGSLMKEFSESIQNEIKLYEEKLINEYNDLMNSYYKKIDHDANYNPMIFFQGKY